MLEQESSTVSEQVSSKRQSSLFSSDKRPTDEKTKKNRPRRFALQAPLEVTDPLASELRRGPKQRAVTAALCMLKGKSSRQLRPIIIPPPKQFQKTSTPKRKLESVESRNGKESSAKQSKKESESLEQTVEGPRARSREVMSDDFSEELLSSEGLSVVSFLSRESSWEERQDYDLKKLDSFNSDEEFLSLESRKCPLGSLISGLDQPDDGLSSLSYCSSPLQEWSTKEFDILM
eukprot:g3594.t1